MAMDMDTLKRLLDGEGLKYFLDPVRPAVLLGFQGLVGHYQFVILVEQEGRFLQLRTIKFAHCPVDHPHLQEVLKVIGGIDYQIRFVKFGWDQDDGEIVGYGDVCLAKDGTLTQAQFKQILQHYITVLEISAKRIRETIETGRDPGQMDPAQLAAKMLGGKGGLPPQLRALLEKLKGKSGPDSGGKPEPNVDEI